MREIHDLHVDVKNVAQSVTKAIVPRNQHVFGPWSFDVAAMPSGVDHGFQGSV